MARGLNFSKIVTACFTEKVAFEQRSERWREPAMWVAREMVFCQKEEQGFI